MKAMRMKNSDDEWHEFKQKLEYLKFSVDPKVLLNSLGFIISKETTKELRSTCAIHGGDNKTAFRFNKEKRSWLCFTHKCHDIFGNDIIALIRAVTGTNFIDAVAYLRQLVGDISSNVGMALEYERQKERRSFLESSTNDTKIHSTIVTESCLEQYKSFRSNSFIEDGFSDDTLDYFEIAGGYTDGFGYLRDIIPIRNDKGDLVAYSMRDIRRDVSDKDYKYVLTKGFTKDKVLYNLHNAKSYIPEDKPSLIVVEGFKSVWRLYDLGIRNVVASMGSGITHGQENLLFSYAINGIVIFFDGDIAGIIGTTSACESLRGRFNVFPVFVADEGKDPSDMDDDTIYNYLRGYI